MRTWVAGSGHVARLYISPAAIVSKPPMPLSTAGTADDSSRARHKRAVQTEPVRIGSAAVCEAVQGPIAMLVASRYSTSCVWLVVARLPKTPMQIPTQSLIDSHDYCASTKRAPRRMYCTRFGHWVLEGFKSIAEARRRNEECIVT